MDLQIIPKKLSGTVTPPPSKSIAHRLLIAAALADGVSTVRGIAMSQDVEATLRCLTAWGAAGKRPPPACWRSPAPAVAGQERTCPGWTAERAAPRCAF